LVEAAVSENVLAGGAMGRREAYQLGVELRAGPKGYVGSSIVTASAKDGTVTLIKPTDSVQRTGATRVKFEFQMVPETEAPSEMNLFLPEQKTLFVSEFATCTIHNSQTPRGALVRDAKQRGCVSDRNLEQYLSSEQAQRYVAVMGGAKGMLREAARASAEGDYCWSTEILNQLVFAQLDSREARENLADSYGQLGYQPESAIWRNIRLTGAAELRGGAASHIGLARPDMVAAMPLNSFLDLLATGLNLESTGDRSMTLKLDVVDTGRKVIVSIRHAVLVPEIGKTIEKPDVQLRGTRRQFAGLFLKKLPIEKLEAAGLQVDGGQDALVVPKAVIEHPHADYRIATP
jgi:alkyl sulfatase BDS1-like metallo-beta-lactamase superfamily hydrolase